MSYIEMSLALIRKLSRNAESNITLPQPITDWMLAFRGSAALRKHKAGDVIKAGDLLARILHPYDGRVLEEVRSPQDGIIFFSHHRPLVLQNALLYRLA